MKISLDIERLVLEGLPVTPGQGAAVQSALEEELARLLEQGGLEGMAGGAVPHLSAPTVQLSPGGEPAELGRQIARTLFSGLAPAPVNPRDRAGSQPRGFTPAERRS